jgi:hypothetical protein
MLIEEFGLKFFKNPVTVLLDQFLFFKNPDSFLYLSINILDASHTTPLSPSFHFPLKIHTFFILFYNLWNNLFANIKKYIFFNFNM